MLVTMVAWLRCVPIVVVSVTARSLVRRPVQNNSVKRGKSVQHQQGARRCG
jgi:hypothetical protein